MPVEVNQQKVLEAEASIPADVQVTMVNLVQFNPEARYENPVEKPCSGREAYLQRYAPAFNEVAKELGVGPIEVLFMGAVAATILGPAEPKWDAIAVVRYANFADLRKITESAEYLERAEPHRRAALKALEWIATYEPFSDPQ